MKHYCPVCDCQMNNPVGNVYVCPVCDFTATDHTLNRIAQVTKPPVRHTTGA